jgi:hypothetical protein
MIINEQDLKAIIVEELQNDEQFEQLLNEALPGLPWLAKKLAPTSRMAVKAATKSFAKKRRKEFLKQFTTDPDFHNEVQRIMRNNTSIKANWDQARRFQDSNPKMAQEYMSQFIHQVDHRMPKSLSQGPAHATKVMPTPKAPPAAPLAPEPAGRMGPFGKAATAAGLGGAYASWDWNYIPKDKHGNPLPGAEAGGPASEALKWVVNQYEDVTGQPRTDWSRTFAEDDELRLEPYTDTPAAKAEEERKERSRQQWERTEGADDFNVDAFQESITRVVDGFLQQRLLGEQASTGRGSGEEDLLVRPEDKESAPKIPQSGEAKSLPVEDEPPIALTTADTEEEEDENLDEQAIPAEPAPTGDTGMPPGSAAADAMKDIPKADTMVTPPPSPAPAPTPPPPATGAEGEKIDTGAPAPAAEPPPKEIDESIKSYQDRIFEEKFNKLKQAFAKQ